MSQQCQCKNTSSNAGQSACQSKGDDFVLSVDTAGPPQVKFLLLDSPPRLSVDLLGEWRWSGSDQIKSASPLVKGVRVGHHQDRLRLVIDLSQKDVKPSVEETDKGVAMFSRTGAKSPNAQQPTTRAWYDRFVSLLPASYRNDPHRREPFPAEDWNVQRASEVRSKVEALNKQLRGADDRKGYGPVSVDGLGNLQVDARSVSAADLSGPIRALADELGAGVAARVGGAK